MANSTIKHEQGEPLYFYLNANSSVTLTFTTEYAGFLVSRGYGGGATFCYFASGYETGTVRQNWTALYDPNNLLSIDLSQPGRTAVLTNTSGTGLQCAFTNYIGALPSIS